ncbi:SusC/RagA family TonB-linked outer membrane protein [Arcticibacter tournemirensis]
MKKRLLMILLGVLFIVMRTSAQQNVVTGKVTSYEDRMPLPGVSVKVKGAGKGTSTDPNGVFRINASPGQVLVFSYVGTVNQEITVGTAASINVVMRSDSKGLNEVIITALGIPREKKAIGYSAQTIQGDEVAQTQRENFLNALQGRVAGATITPTNGLPGSSAQMVIRGAVSFDGDNQPLFVVDGLPISNRTFSEYNLVGQGTFNRNNDYGNRAMDINPEEIASITILKGPEASALYGTDGASGAVVITTKRAKAGTAKVNYSNSFRVENVYRFPEIQTVYGPGTSSAPGVYDEEQRTYFGAKYPVDATRYDNLGSFFETGFTQKHNLAVEGGTEALSLRSSVSYDNQKGTVPNTGFNQLNFKLTGTSKISPKLSMNSSVNFITNKTDKTYKGAGSPMISVLSWPIVDDMRNYLTTEGNRRLIGSSNTGELDNPFWGVAKNPNWEKTSRVLSNIGVDYKPSDWFGVVARAGADVYTSQGLSAYHPQSYSGYSSSGTINTYAANSRLYNGSVIATLKKTYGQFSPILRVGSNIDYSRYEVNSQNGSKFYNQDYYSLNNTDPTTAQVYYSDENRRKVGVFANAEFGYGQFLYLTLTGRYEKSSTLPKKNNGFFYPASSLSFVFSEIGPFKNYSWISLGKLRASWGQSGKDARVPYITGTSLVAQKTTGGGFATNTTAGNPDLEAEFTTASEVGLEMGFLKNRLSFDFSYYETVSDKQITAPRLSYATGAVLKYINGGKIRYRGFELLLKGTPVLKENFSWDISANFARTRGKILALPAGLPAFYVSDTWLFDNVRAQYSIGSSVSSFGSYAFLRNDAGELLISPANGMPIKTTDFVQMGDRAPDITIGLTNSFTYKNFNLSFLLDIRKGGDIFNATELYLYARGLSKLTVDRETPRLIKGVLRDGLENTPNPTQNTIQVVPYITASYYATYYSPEDFIERDINWIRMKDITLSYALPKNIFKTSKVFKSASVFFTGTDVLLLTNYKGVDPQVNGLSAAAGGLGGTGIDYGSVGLPRGYNFGIKVGF